MFYILPSYIYYLSSLSEAGGRPLFLLLTGVTWVGVVTGAGAGDELGTMAAGGLWELLAVAAIDNICCEERGKIKHITS